MMCSSVCVWFSVPAEAGLLIGVYPCFLFRLCSHSRMGTALNLDTFKCLVASVSLYVSNIGLPVDNSTMTHDAVRLRDCVKAMIFLQCLPCTIAWHGCIVAWFLVCQCFSSDFLHFVALCFKAYINFTNTV